jgi:hypothetical protein
MSSNVPYVATQFVRHNNNVLSAVLVELQNDVAWRADAGDRMKELFVSANWFDELGYGPAPGRMLHQEFDERPEAPPVVVISQRLWETRLECALGSILPFGFVQERADSRYRAETCVCINCIEPDKRHARQGDWVSARHRTSRPPYDAAWRVRLHATGARPAVCRSNWAKRRWIVRTSRSSKYGSPHCPHTHAGTASSGKW